MAYRSSGRVGQHYYEETIIPMPWGEVAGRWWGPRDKQPILAIHGWQDNAGTWNNLIPLLPPTLSILCIDLPGMGLSAHYPKGIMYYKHWDGIALTRRIVKHYNWDRITIMGHSIGGSIGFLYAAVYPDEIDRLICIDIASPAVQTIQDSINNISTSIDQTLRYEDFNNKILLPYNDMIEMAFHAYAGSVSKENCKIMLERGMTRGVCQGKIGYYFNRDPKLKHSTLASITIDESMELATKIRCKILNIKSRPKPNVFVTFYEYYDKVLNAVKENTDLTLVEVEGTHHVHLETPERVAIHINAFLEDLSQ